MAVVSHIGEGVCTVEVQVWRVGPLAAVAVKGEGAVGAGRIDDTPGF